MNESEIFRHGQAIVRELMKASPHITVVITDKGIKICEDVSFEPNRLCSEFSVNARFHDKTVHILRSSEPEAVTEPPPLAARSVLDRLA